MKANPATNRVHGRKFATNRAMREAPTSGCRVPGSELEISGSSPRVCTDASGAIRCSVRGMPLIFSER